jgi:uncharacterized protein with NRDE domain
MGTWLGVARSGRFALLTNHRSLWGEVTFRLRTDLFTRLIVAALAAGTL